MVKELIKTNKLNLNCGKNQRVQAIQLIPLIIIILKRHKPNHNCKYGTTTPMTITTVTIAPPTTSHDTAPPYGTHCIQNQIINKGWNRGKNERWWSFKGRTIRTRKGRTGGSKKMKTEEEGIWLEKRKKEERWKLNDEEKKHIWKFYLGKRRYLI